MVSSRKSYVVQYHDDPQLRAEVLRIAIDAQERPQCGTKQDDVDYFLVLQGKRGELRRQREDNVMVLDRQVMSARRVVVVGGITAGPKWIVRLTQQGTRHGSEAQDTPGD